jgi:hypothetical protein
VLLLLQEDGCGYQQFYFGPEGKGTNSGSDSDGEEDFGDDAKLQDGEEEETEEPSSSEGDS